MNKSKLALGVSCIILSLSLTSAQGAAVKSTKAAPAPTMVEKEHGGKHHGEEHGGKHHGEEHGGKHDGKEHDGKHDGHGKK